MALLVSAPGKEKEDGGFGKDELHKIQVRASLCCAGHLCDLLFGALQVPAPKH